MALPSMTPDRDAIRKRCEAATKPPWSMTRSVVFGAALWGGDRSCLFRIESDIERSTVSDADPVSQWEKDARFVYHAREDIPALLDEVERLTAEVERLGLSCPVAGHDAPVEPVPEGAVQQAAPIRCPHCARKLRQSLNALLSNFEAAEDREHGWKLQAQVAEAEVARLTADREAGERQRDADYGKIIAWLHAHGEIAGDLDALDLMIALADKMIAARKTADFTADEAQQGEQRLVGEIARLTARLRAGEEVIAFYADPLTYIAIGFVFDPPCGAFAADIDKTEYGAKPGKIARAFLDDAVAQALNQIDRIAPNRHA